MIKSYLKYKNLIKKIDNYILISYDFNNIKLSLINIIKKKFQIKITFINKKVLKYFNIYFNKSVNVIILNKDYSLLTNIIIFINNIIEKIPFFIYDKTSFIKKIPLSEISKLSKENLIIKLLNFFKTKILNLKKILNIYAKYINR